MKSSEYLPPELIAQLSNKKVKSLPEHTIFNILENSEIPLCIDDILIAHWKGSSHIMQRKVAVYAIKTLISKNLIESVRHGVYTIAKSGGKNGS
jgi:hypothetical protein